MERFLYIGQYTEGTTSKMRADTLKQQLQPAIFSVIDIHVPFYKTPKFFRSLGFRYKKGPLIKRVNNYILGLLGTDTYDMIWVDKGVYISSKTTRILRTKTPKLIHFTPDPAFTFHQSPLFFKSLPNYDFVITTKSYELDAYRKACTTNKVLYATQGFDRQLHQPSKEPFSEKDGFVFIGHHEREREAILELLLKHQVKITLAGIKWQTFAKRHQTNPLLNYLGEGVYGDQYVRAIQKGKIAWGAISKWVAELHTTRTFEIPACGTALLTERNTETQLFFKDDEVIFYSNPDELVSQVKFFMHNDNALEELTKKGSAVVYQQGYDYASIFSKLLQTLLD
ncbi:glycosyltransferase [Paucihalobacter ruber]|uniref:Glycosyltransferase n=1 Tax=Paucihalobacter ruber TaxID=2567861 RepID=A0A506PU32_9FLAO|nr:glycosyltransferase [Paucihalobacter ruber]TPV35740.1 glycosyltransferase [Paucihalobacter ruber]